ncbi:MAG TPA: DUF3592 domain-containing protein [Afifellaceae bacterium]|nr:DUF3592 domain-containing protein [Afifellaceae bacterium]
MGNYIKLGIGALLILLSFVGIFSLFSGQVEEVGRQIAENGIDVTGTVEKRERHIVGVRIGRIPAGTIYYTMTYNFTTQEGQKYGGEVDVSKEQAYALQDGQTISVRYLNGQPSINSATGFEDYFSAADAEDVPYGTFIFSSLLFFSGGLYLVVSSWFRIRPASGGGAASARLAGMRAQPSAAGAPAGGGQDGGRSGGFGRR